MQRKSQKYRDRARDRVRHTAIEPDVQSQSQKYNYRARDRPRHVETEPFIATQKQTDGDSHKAEADTKSGIKA